MMYQVQVTNARGEQILVGPRMGHESALYPFVETINKAVVRGNEKDWRDAQVVPVGIIKS